MPAAILLDGTVIPLRINHDPLSLGVARHNGPYSNVGKLEICYYNDGIDIPEHIRNHVIKTPSNRWHSADFVIPNEKILYFIGLPK